MIYIPGNLKRALEISSWLRANGLVPERDYKWYQDFLPDTLPRIVFEFRDSRWESMTLMRWS